MTTEKPGKKTPRKSAKVADLEALERKLQERDVRIADIGKIADQVLEMVTPIKVGDEGRKVDFPGSDEALVKIEAILAIVRGEDLGEWARARIGL